MTRRAAEDSLRSSQILYYEEYPYFQSEEQLSSALGEVNRWRSSVISLEPVSVVARIRAVACYQSQISTFFDDVEDMASRVSQRIDEVGGERFWNKAANYP